MAKICFDVDKLRKLVDWINSYKIPDIFIKLDFNKLIFYHRERIDPIEGVIIEDDVFQKLDNVDKAKIILELDKIEKELDTLKKKIDNSIEFPKIRFNKDQ